MKIYTRTGDKGETSLFTGKRVLKSHRWVHLYGCLDELNCSVGVLCSKLSEKSEFKSLVEEQLTFIQRNLFSLGSYYASEATKLEHVEKLEDWVKVLEESMDRLSEPLPPLKNFILPGGSFESSLAHLARVKARSLEREALVADLGAPVLNTIVYLNRLSDYFFVLARYVNFKLSTEDVIWVSEV